MKKIVLYLFLTIFLTSILNAQPKLEIVGGNTYDWGKVTPKVLTTKIQFKNIGNKPLYISHIKPSCGCTTAPMDKRTLEPGEIGTMSVNLSLDISSVGKIVKKIEISSNDPVSPDTTVYLQCMIVNPLDIKPHAFFKFDDLTVGYESKSSVQITNVTNEVITLSKFEVQPEFVKINVANTVELKPGETFNLVASVRPNEQGNINVYVKFATSHPDMQNFTLNGFGTAKASNLFGY